MTSPVRAVLYGALVLVAGCAKPVLRGFAPVLSDSATFSVLGALGVEAVRRDLDVMASVSWHLRREQSRCVTGWTLGRRAGQPFLTLHHLGPSEVAYSDSLNLWVYRTAVPWDSTYRLRLCGDSLPDIHSHVVANGYEGDPSPRDLETAFAHPALFRLLMVVKDSVTYRLVVYGMKGRPN